jgi:hypothetical protein
MSSLGFENWSSGTVYLADLKSSTVTNLVQIGVIPKYNKGSYEVSECNLLLNRLKHLIDIEKPYLKICELTSDSSILDRNRNASLCDHI